MLTESIVRTPISETTQMRDAVINRLFDLAKKDKDIIFYTADMGAQALDRWRSDLPEQYKDVGIAEQGMASIAAGMAKEGKKVFIYAIGPFITTRIHEFHKLNAGVQNIPYNTIGMGTGYSYGDSGPTHYQREDIAIMRTIPNMEILSPSNGNMAADMAEHACYSDTPTYLRLERSVLPMSHKGSDSLKRGFNEIIKGDYICLVATGDMVHRALEVQKALEEERGEKVGVIDLYRLKPLNEDLIKHLKEYGRVVTLEEQYLAGGLGSLIGETILDNNSPIRLTRIGIPEEQQYLYGRENTHREFGLDLQSLVERVKNLRR